MPSLLTVASSKNSISLIFAKQLSTFSFINLLHIFSEKVVGEKGKKHCKCRDTGTAKSNVTTTIACSANGLYAPPCMIFPCDKAPTKYGLAAKKNNIEFTSNKSGWQDAATFMYYLKDVFYKHLITIGIKFPIALFFDGHRSHLTLEVYKFCQSVQIRPVCFFPNSTHLSSPLDLRVFNHLQREFEAAKDIYYQREGVPVNLLSFPEVLRVACDAALIAKHAISGFKTAGLRPFEFSNMKTSNLWGKPSGSQVKLIQKL
jgi:hypothetical protein